MNRRDFGSQVRLLAYCLNFIDIWLPWARDVFHQTLSAQSIWSCSVASAVVVMASSIGELAIVAHKFITAPQANPQTFCNLTQN